ncbi:hypothetical protein JCM10213v2_001404 [Rhodosporidiobolus nylandii]
MARAGWRTVFDATIADVRTAFTHRKDLIEQFPRPDDRVKGFAQWSHPLKEEAEIMENHSKNGMRGDADEVKERFRGLQAQALKELEAVRDEVKDGTVKTVANLPPLTDRTAFPALNEALAIVHNAKDRARKNRKARETGYRAKKRQDQAASSSSQSQYRERDESPPAESCLPFPSLGTTLMLDTLLQRRSASPPPELRSLAVFHRRLTHRQAQLYGTTQRAFAEGRAF